MITFARWREWQHERKASQSADGWEGKGARAL